VDDHWGHCSVVARVNEGEREERVLEKHEGWQSHTVVRLFVVVYLCWSVVSSVKCQLLSELVSNVLCG